jgi:hydroxypyruvate isomerase
MQRREFLHASALSGVSLAAIRSTTSATLAGAPIARAGDEFRMKYAPHFGMFRHHAGEGVLDQLRFMADEGFRALEDNWMGRRPVDEQSSIAKEMEKLSMEMGVFVAHADFGAMTFASDTDEARDRIKKDITSAVEVAKRVNARWCTVVPGTYSTRDEWDYQTATVIENLKIAAEICEPSGLVMVLEPLNPWRDHPNLFLSKIPQAYLLCRAVGSPSCKILDDLYHQQITEGNLIPNADRAWDEIAYIQVGDNPGRKEPGTGEINYGNVFRHLHEKGFDGIVGMEHGNSRGGKEGERAVIDAYRACDAVVAMAGKKGLACNARAGSRNQSYDGRASRPLRRDLHEVVRPRADLACGRSRRFRRDRFVSARRALGRARDRARDSTPGASSTDETFDGTDAAVARANGPARDRDDRLLAAQQRGDPSLQRRPFSEPARLDRRRLGRARL